MQILIKELYEFLETEDARVEKLIDTIPQDLSKKEREDRLAVYSGMLQAHGNVRSLIVYKGKWAGVL